MSELTEAQVDYITEKILCSEKEYLLPIISQLVSDHPKNSFALIWAIKTNDKEIIEMLSDSNRIDSKIDFDILRKSAL